MTTGAASLMGVPPRSPSRGGCRSGPGGVAVDVTGALDPSGPRNRYGPCWSPTNAAAVGGCRIDQAGLIPATYELSEMDGVRYAERHPGEDPDSKTGTPPSCALATRAVGRADAVDQPARHLLVHHPRPAPAGPPGSTTPSLPRVHGGLIWTDSTAGGRCLRWPGHRPRRRVRHRGAGVLPRHRRGPARRPRQPVRRHEPGPCNRCRPAPNASCQAVGVSTAGLTVADRRALYDIPVDVDRQAAAALLIELAVDHRLGAVGSRTTRPRPARILLRVRRPRVPVRVAQTSRRCLWAPAAGSGAGTPVSACQVLRDPVQWSRAVTDLITRATVRWQDRPPPAPPNGPCIDRRRRGNRVRRPGNRHRHPADRVHDADALAAGTLAGRQPSPSSRAAGLTWGLAASGPPGPGGARPGVRPAGWVGPGSGRSRPHRPTYWTPTAAAVQLYVEGGSYRST